MRLNWLSSAEHDQQSELAQSSCTCRCETGTAVTCMWWDNVSKASHVPWQDYKRTEKEEDCCFPKKIDFSASIFSTFDRREVSDRPVDKHPRKTNRLALGHQLVSNAGKLPTLARCLKIKANLSASSWVAYLWKWTLSGSFPTIWIQT